MASVATDPLVLSKWEFSSPRASSLAGAGDDLPAHVLIGQGNATDARGVPPVLLALVLVSRPVRAE